MQSALHVRALPTTFVMSSSPRVCTMNHSASPSTQSSDRGLTLITQLPVVNWVKSDGITDPQPTASDPLHELQVTSTQYLQCSCVGGERAPAVLYKRTPVVLSVITGNTCIACASGYLPLIHNPRLSEIVCTTQTPHSVWHVSGDIAAHYTRGPESLPQQTTVEQ
jgi:hypothetical protein